jgi:hypothetical protein
MKASSTYFGGDAIIWGISRTSGSFGISDFTGDVALTFSGDP